MASSASKDSVKIILLGDSAVGKSKLVERFLMDKYEPQQLSTFALTLFHYTTEGGTEVDFWDTAGQERFNQMHPSYYDRAHFCILVFDISRKITYKNLEKWYTELQSYRKGIPCCVVANKIDIDYKVTQKTFSFASKRGIPLYYVSASDGTNVVKMFNDAISSGQKHRDNAPKDFLDDVLDLLHEDDEDEQEAASSAAASK